MILELTIAGSVAAASLYGIVRASLSFVERMESREAEADGDIDLSSMTNKELRTMREQLRTDYNWWSRTIPDEPRRTECARCLEAIARIDREAVRRTGQ
jgi:iron only hydrogenase large subunit-like protein